MLTLWRDYCSISSRKERRAVANRAMHNMCELSSVIWDPLPMGAVFVVLFAAPALSITLNAVGLTFMDRFIVWVILAWPCVVGVVYAVFVACRMCWHLRHETERATSPAPDAPSMPPTALRRQTLPRWIGPVPALSRCPSVEDAIIAWRRARVELRPRAAKPERVALAALGVIALVVLLAYLGLDPPTWAQRALGYAFAMAFLALLPAAWLLHRRRLNAEAVRIIESGFASSPA